MTESLPFLSSPSFERVVGRRPWKTPPSYRREKYYSVGTMLKLSAIGARRSKLRQQTPVMEQTYCAAQCPMSHPPVGLEC
jgi:hypothetical protein